MIGRIHLIKNRILLNPQNRPLQRPNGLGVVGLVLSFYSASRYKRSSSVKSEISTSDPASSSSRPKPA